MPDLSISLFGVFEVHLDGVLITHFESAKVRALLAYLAAEAGRTHNRASLAGLLWPDWPEEAAQKNLRHTLYSLRKTLGDDKASTPGATPLIQSDRQYTTFQPREDCQIDVLELEKALSRANQLTTTDSGRQFMVSGLRSAVELYRGPFLEGFSLGDSPAFEEWVLGRREHHRQQMLQALGRLADCYEKTGDYEQAEAYTRRQLELEAWHEKAHQQLMRILALKGERVQALAQYDQLIKALKAELGVQPSEETVRLYEQIRDGKLSAQPEPVTASRRLPKKPRHNLPVCLSSFIGREKELVQIRDLLAQHRLVTLTGAGGVGKTRLAIQTVDQMVDIYEDGVWYVELAPLADPALVPSTTARVLGLYEEGGRDSLKQIQDCLRCKEALIVLDNCEHVLDGCIRLADGLLTHCPGIKILTASREPLGIAGEMVCRVFSLPFPDSAQPSSPDQLQGWEAVRLLVERAQAVLPDFQLTEHNAAAVAHICQRLDGIPLALELAAARLNVLSPEQLAERLKDAFRLLTGGSRTALPRQQTLRAAIDWSYNLLSEGEKALLQRLAIFAGSFSLEGVEGVCSGNGLEVETILDLLSELVSKSMVTTLHDPSLEPRYRLLETVRQYAQEMLSTSPQTVILRDRHLAYYQELAERIEPRLRSPQQIPSLRQLEQELPNIRLALDWADDEEPPLEARLGKGLILCGALQYFWHPRCRHIEGIEWLERLLKLDQKRWNDRSLSSFMCQARARALLALDLLCEHISFPVDREALLTESLSLSRQLGEKGKHGVALANLYLAIVRQEQDVHRSWCQIEECYLVFQGMGDTFHMAECLLRLSGLAAGKCDFALAERYLVNCLALRQEIGDRDGESQFLAELGLWAARQGEPERAMKLFAEARSSMFEHEDVLYASGWTHYSLGEFAWQEGDCAQAEEEFILASNSDQQQGFTAISALEKRGKLALSQGDYTRAGQLFTELATIAQLKQEAFNILACSLGFADLARLQGNFVEADRLYQSTLTSSPFLVQKAFAYTGLAKTAIVQANNKAAAVCFKQALELWKNINNRYVDGYEPLELMAALAVALGKSEASAILFGATQLSYQCNHLTYPPPQRQLMEDAKSTARALLGDTAFSASFEKGREMSYDKAIDFALAISAE